MQCPDCGYMMTAFEKVCPRCATRPKPAVIAASVAAPEGKICPQCGRVTELGRKACEGCSHQFRTNFAEAPTLDTTQLLSKQPSPVPTASSVSPARLSGKAIAWIVVIAAFIILSYATYDPKRDTPSDAYFFATDYLQDKLKSPTTADFARFSEDEVETLGPHKYLCHAWVDAENSFGAKLRQDWSCVVEHQSGDLWTVQGYTIGDQAVGDMGDSLPASSAPPDRSLGFQ